MDDVSNLRVDARLNRQQKYMGATEDVEPGLNESSNAERPNLRVTKIGNWNWENWLNIKRKSSNFWSQIWFFLIKQNSRNLLIFQSGQFERCPI